MEEIQSLMHGFNVALSPTNVALMFVGVILGVIIGVLPGLGGANGVAILLPLTFGMAQTTGERKVITTTATNAPTNEEVKAAVSAVPARPCCASG